MSYSSSALSETLAALGMRQRDLAEATHIPAPQISRYCTGANTIPLENLSRILPAIPEEHHPRILVAYLRDNIPAGFEYLVSVQPLGQRLAKISPDAPLLPGIDRELDQMLRTYADLAMRHPQVREMLRGFLAAIRAV